MTDDGHPSLDITGTHSDKLRGRKIILCVAGSVAAYKAIELARLLMRHGADVTCVPSGAACRLVTPEYFKWATGNSPITELTGELEHIRMADYNAADAILVYPATANVLGKMANGIDDTPMSTILATAMGSKIPIIVGVAMHRAMYENPAVRDNIRYLDKTVRFIEPHVAEGKARLAEPEEVLEHMLNTAESPLRGKSILVTAGATVEYLDPVRIITNVSTGITGMLLAAELVRAGARVVVIYGQGSARPAAGAQIIRVRTAAEMDRAVRAEIKKCDIAIMAAAVSDYCPKVRQKTKMKSDRPETEITLVRTPKILDAVKKMRSDLFLVGFKAETDVTMDSLVKSARKKLHESRADIIIANDIGKKYQKNPAGNRIAIVDAGSARRLKWQSKQDIARAIREEIESRI